MILFKILLIAFLCFRLSKSLQAHNRQIRNNNRSKWHSSSIKNWNELPAANSYFHYIYGNFEHNKDLAPIRSMRNMSQGYVHLQIHKLCRKNPTYPSLAHSQVTTIILVVSNFDSLRGCALCAGKMNYHGNFWLWGAFRYLSKLVSSIMPRAGESLVHWGYLTRLLDPKVGESAEFSEFSRGF